MMTGMENTEDLLSIGVFARRVGLAPSALRFYADCDVLCPSYVDNATGYRYYGPEQESRARLIRRLRQAGLPLVEVAAVLDGTPQESREILRRHARTARETAAATQLAIDHVLRDLLADGSIQPNHDSTVGNGENADGGTEMVNAAEGAAVNARIGGAELFSAVRQVSPAVAIGAAREEFPALGRVLIELDDREVRLVATDRYRLAVRVLRSGSAIGGVSQILVDAQELKEAASWALPRLEIELEITGRQVRISADGQSRELSGCGEAFPSYRMILDHLPAAETRVIIDREAFRRTLTPGEGDGPVAVRTAADRLLVSSPGSTETSLRAICTGPPIRIAFVPAMLLPVLEAGVGPDVLLEISSPRQPVVVRSADQGSFTTLVMPVATALVGD